MDLKIADRVAMIAAASKGIGRACALSLAQAGCKVSLCARGADALAAVGRECREAGAPAVHTTVADVSVAGDLGRWHAETEASLGPVDILVTNTGGPPVARFMALTEADWARGVDGTLMNVVRLCRLVIP